VRAKIARRAPAWRWGSCHVRQRGPAELAGLLSDWPIEQPQDWDDWLDEAVSDVESERIATAIRRSSPLGDAAWTQSTARRLNLEHTLNPRGRPRRQNDENEARPL
jgi:putative transposase